MNIKSDDDGQNEVKEKLAQHMWQLVLRNLKAQHPDLTENQITALRGSYYCGFWHSWRVMDKLAETKPSESTIMMWLQIAREYEEWQKDCTDYVHKYK